MNEKNIMSKEAFNELIDGLEYVESLTEYGRKNIKYHVQKLQQENKQLKENYERIYNENCKLREEHNITDISLLDENYKLKDNWNKLKELTINSLDFYKGTDCEYIKTQREFGIREAYRIILGKMQEIEGSDSNE